MSFRNVVIEFHIPEKLSRTSVSEKASPPPLSQPKIIAGDAAHAAGRSACSVSAHGPARMPSFEACDRKLDVVGSSLVSGENKNPDCLGVVGWTDRSQDPACGVGVSKLTRVSATRSTLATSWLTANRTLTPFSVAACSVAALLSTAARKTQIVVLSWRVYQTHLRPTLDERIVLYGA